MVPLGQIDRQSTHVTRATLRPRRHHGRRPRQRDGVLRRAGSAGRGPDVHRGRVRGHRRRHPDSRSEIVMLRPPGGGTGLELSSFVRPEHQPGSQAAMSTELGLRNVAFEVDDVRAAVDGAADGYGLVGGIGQYEYVWRMAYVCGPEGMI